jgi:divalent metal cation (Fe/Co/Zn/Cd) transporter
MDHSPEAALVSTIEGVAGSVEAFKAIEKLRMRKAGTGYFVDVHVQAEPLLSLRDAHILSGRVKSAIRNAVPSVLGVLVHMEPFEAGLTTHKVLPRRSPHPHCPFSTRADPRSAFR